jgi:competence protein ComEC
VTGASGFHGGWPASAAIIGGSLLVPLLPAAPPRPLVALLLVVAGVLLFYRKVRWPALLLLTACWSLLHFHARLLDRLDPALGGQIRTISGTVRTAPQEFNDSVRFQFRPDPDVSRKGLPDILLVSWYRDWPAIRAGERWRLELRLKPPWGAVNFAGPDRERWYFAEGVGGLASVRAGFRLEVVDASVAAVQQVRGYLNSLISTTLASPLQSGIVRALATADRSGLGPRQRHVLMATGTAHLLAISGLHIGLAAAGGMAAVRAVFWLLPFMLPGRLYVLTTLLAGLAAAAAYALLANLGISTQRAALMATVAIVAIVTTRAIHFFHAWVVTVVAVLLLDPFAPLTAGFWFSFLAVAALMIFFQPRTGRPPIWKNLIAAQLAVMLVMIPVSAAWFEAFSPMGFAANLAAIPWVSIFIVPLVLLGIGAAPISEAVAGGLWTVAGQAASVLMWFLGKLSAIQPFMTALPTTGLAHLILAVAGGVLLLLPRGVAARKAGLFLLVPLFLPQSERTPDGSLRVDFLDAGQGTAVVVSTRNHALLYDTGPGDGLDANLVGSVIVPALNSLGIDTPDRVVVSHGDHDHSGGLHGIRTRFPRAAYFVNSEATLTGSGKTGIPGRALASCNTELAWRWNGIDFRALHPAVGLPYLRNDSSCVLSVDGGHGRSVLLAGDISKAVEERLLIEGLGPHHLLLVPHHGSTSSSGGAFIRAVKPAAAVATASLGNRFGFPREEVRRRYTRSGVEFWPTGECGGIRFVLRDGTVGTVSSARRERPRIWRRPPAANCP